MLYVENELYTSFRNLKSENVLLDAEGHCVLANFGVSCENIIPGVTTSNDYAGTVEYMAPEVWFAMVIYILLLKIV